MRAFSPAFATVLMVLASGCIHRIESPTQRLDDAAAAVKEGSTASKSLALAGFHALLIAGDADQARTHFEAALSKDAASPWALMGQIFLGYRAANPQQQLSAALDLCDRNPKHALCSVAARMALEIAGTATSTDDVILQRIPPILEKGVTGDAAYLLRAAMQSVALTRNDLALNAKLLADMGVTTVGTFVGPLSPWHVLSMSDVSDLEKTGSLEHPGNGAFGPLVVRTATFADGKFSLEGEPPNADGYLLLVDADVKESGHYAVRTISSMDHVVLLDGTRVMDRLTWQHPAATLSTRAVDLKAGTHRFVIRMAKEQNAGQLTLALTTLEGNAAPVTFRPAAGAASQWTGKLEATDDELLMPTAARVQATLAPEVGDALADVVAAFDARGRDHDGARRMLARVPATITSPLISVLRAELDSTDKVLPQKVAHGRATRDLEAALLKDKNFTRATLQTVTLAADDGRALDALEALKVAKAGSTYVSPAVLQLQSQLELQLGLDAQASMTSKETLKALPGTCDALTLQFDIAGRRDASAEAAAALQALQQCPGHLPRAANYLTKHGDLAGAVTAWTDMLAFDSGRVSIATNLSQALVAQRKFDDAIALLLKVKTQWPRNAAILKSLADVYAMAGKNDEALKTREAALLLDGADLNLRRTVERAKTGKELLEARAISTEEALKAYEAAPGNEEVSAAFLLDAAAIEAFADGSQVDRIHIMQKAMDQNGVQEVAEVTIPQGVALLKLRTLKPDGSVLEPEGIENKDTVSMPGVQVGDIVEYEYLQAHPSRGPSQPGFTSSNFYFQVARQPNNWSTYTVIAPAGSGLKVDAHNMDAAAPKVEGDREVFTHTEKRVAPFIPEPMSSPSGNEWLPFVSVGSGQTGNEAVIHAYADAFAELGLVTSEVEAFAKEAAGAAVGSDAVRAVYVAVMKKLSGRDAGLTTSAGASVSQDRGSRTWLLKASLNSLGFDARLVAVRAFTADPAPYLFPNEGSLPYLCLRVSLPDGTFIWLDPLTRFAPFGELPEFALGEREAYVFPEPGRAMEKVKTPKQSVKPGKTVKLTMALDEKGVLTGQGIEEYVGFDAAQLAEALESISPEQRTQALQGALSRYFGGADMADLDVKAPREVGASVTVKYKFTAPRFGRREGDSRMVLGPLTFPAMMGRRYLMLSSRTTPLFIESSEKTNVSATIKLPAGWKLNDPVADLKLSHTAGKFLRSEAQNGDALTILEDISLLQSRVPVAEYEAFGQFAGEVDLVQGRDVLLEKK